VAIIGLSLASLLVADRLGEFGVAVAIVDKGRKEGRMRDDFQVVENGVMILEGGSTRNSYSRALEQVLPCPPRAPFFLATSPYLRTECSYSTRKANPTPSNVFA
jgi:hypothetical protein